MSHSDEMLTDFRETVEAGLDPCLCQEKQVASEVELPRIVPKVDALVEFISSGLWFSLTTNPCFVYCTFYLMFAAVVLTLNYQLTISSSCQ